MLNLLRAFSFLTLFLTFHCYAGGVVGTWRLVSIETIRDDGEVIHEWMGAKPTGLIVYEANGLMSVQIMRDPRPMFAEGSRLKGTPEEEIKTAYMGYYAYWGRYTVNDSEGTISHQVESSLWPEEVGKQNKRKYTLEGNRLTLTTPPYKRGDEQRVNKLTWERTE